jgi:hypothetical protein
MREMKIRRLDDISEIFELKPLEDIVEIRVGPSIFHRFLGLYAGLNEEGNHVVIDQKQDDHPKEREQIHDNYLINPVIEEGAIYVNDLPCRYVRPGDKSYGDKKIALQRNKLWNGELAPRVFTDEDEVGDL